jgi:heptosyltransferase-2
MDRPLGTLVIQTAFLGDVILSTPLLSALAERHGPVDVVTTPAAAVLLETHPAVRAVLPYDKRGADSRARGSASASRTARPQRLIPSGCRGRVTATRWSAC